MPGYDSFDASAAYDFGPVQAKLQVFNLLDKRAVTSFNGTQLYSTSDSGLYLYQVGRQVQLTLTARFH